MGDRGECEGDSFNDNVEKFSRCKPLDSLDELLAWTSAEDWAEEVKDMRSRTKFFYRASDLTCHFTGNVLKGRRLLDGQAAKTLVCHDMRGGYLDDRYVYGAPFDPSSQYAFFHWMAIDTFVYFSHHFITIPPLMWINAAHEHGVEIYGTIITEGKQGRKIWEDILSEDESVIRDVVGKLGDICRAYKFDGYLLNVESTLQENRLALMKKFLKFLKRDLSSKKLMWYDAVSLLTGKVDYQNELNDHNIAAFELCDSIFLNYAFKDKNLRNSALRAGHRWFDVYVGVDVFGRSNHGGGFLCNVTADMIRQQNLSMAIFAPGWTVERGCDPENWFETEQRFWSCLAKCLFIHGYSGLPFKTTFHLGVGKSSDRGKCWYDLSKQNFKMMPLFCGEEGYDCARLYFHPNIKGHDGKSGCVVISDKPSWRRILICDFPTDDLLLTIAVRIKGVEDGSQAVLGVVVEPDTADFGSPTCTGNPVFYKVELKGLPLKSDGTVRNPDWDYVKIASASKEVINDDGVVEHWLVNEYNLKKTGYRMTEVSLKVAELGLIPGFLSLLENQNIEEREIAQCMEEKATI